MGPRRRAAIVVVSVLGHLALLAVVLLTRPEPAAGGDTGVMTVSLLDGDALMVAAKPQPPAAGPPPAPPTPPAPEAEPPETTDVDPIFADLALPPSDLTTEPEPVGDPAPEVLAAASGGAPGDVCRLDNWLGPTLAADPRVAPALAAIPVAQRSIANAIMLWDGAWVGPPPEGSGADQLRVVLQAALETAPEECRASLVSGPVLVTLPDPTGATVLVIGSGQWRWGDLLNDGDLMDRLARTFRLR